jgi:hypothetical protein
MLQFGEEACLDLTPVDAREASTRVGIAAKDNEEDTITERKVTKDILRVH